MLFIYTCRAHPVLADFIREVYWNAYAAGRDVLTNDEAKAFVEAAVRDGKTTTEWAPSMVRRVGSYLTGCCADFGLLERGTKRTRQILSFHIEPTVAAILAYDLHFRGLGDNQVVNHADWGLFGLEPSDVIDELKRLSRRGYFIVQMAGGVIRLGWQYKSMEELTDVLTRQ